MCIRDSNKLSPPYVVCLLWLRHTSQQWRPTLMADKVARQPTIELQIKYKLTVEQTVITSSNLAVMLNQSNSMFRKCAELRGMRSVCRQMHWNTFGWVGLCYATQRSDDQMLTLHNPIRWTQSSNYKHGHAYQCIGRPPVCFYYHFTDPGRAVGPLCVSVCVNLL